MYRILPLSKCSPDVHNSVAIAYVGESSWPSVEQRDPSAEMRRAEEAVQAQPSVLFTTPAIRSLIAGRCARTRFIINKQPWLPFGQFVLRTLGEPAVLRTSPFTLYERCVVGEASISPGAVIGGASISADMTALGLVRRPQIGGVRVGAGTYIGPNTSVERGTLEDTIIGRRCLLDSQVKVSHNCVLGDDVTVLGGAVLEGHVTLERGAYVGTCAAIRKGVTVGAGAIIGSSSLVLRDVPAGCVAFGVPASVVREVPPCEYRL